MRFEWDPNKAATNEVRRGISFDEASEVFYDPHAVILSDDEHSWDELRMRVIGASSQRLLLVVFVEKQADTIRIISAREPENHEKKLYYESFL
jgi:uncharacterized DUF497 family protein